MEDVPQGYISPLRYIVPLCQRCTVMAVICQGVRYVLTLLFCFDALQRPSRHFRPSFPPFPSLPSLSISSQPTALPALRPAHPLRLYPQALPPYAPPAPLLPLPPPPLSHPSPPLSRLPVPLPIGPGHPPQRRRIVMVPRRPPRHRHSAPRGQIHTRCRQRTKRLRHRRRRQSARPSRHRPC